MAGGGETGFPGFCFNRKAAAPNNRTFTTRDVPSSVFVFIICETGSSVSYLSKTGEMLQASLRRPVAGQNYSYENSVPFYLTSQCSIPHATDAQCADFIIGVLACLEGGAAGQAQSLAARPELCTGRRRVRRWFLRVLEAF